MSDFHKWDLSLQDAMALQQRLRSKLILHGDPKPRLVAGVDCSYSRNSDDMFAAVILYDLRKDAIVGRAFSCVKTDFPYVTGFLAFREGPAVLAAFAGLKMKPEALIFDGQGIAHPRRLGIAAHLGLLLDLPGVGCGKTRLCGSAEEPGLEKGSFSPLLMGDERVGILLRTKRAVKPLYVSPGHRISIEGSANLVLESCRGYRLPEPTRLAHIEVNRFRRDFSQTAIGEKV